MDKGIKIYVGLDVHKDTIAVASAEPGRAPGHAVGTIAHFETDPLMRYVHPMGATLVDTTPALRKD